MMRVLVLMSGVVTLSACGATSVSSDFAAQSQGAPTGKIRIAIIGNSITHHDPKPKIGWLNNNGMAASDTRHDFSHLLLTKIGAKASESYIRNFYPFETDNEGAARNIESLTPVMAKAPDVVILELGDNVAGKNPLKLYNFDANYAELVDKVKSAKSLFCLSTWWGARFTDYVIKRQCEAGGGTYVYIGDIFDDAANPDKTLPHYAEEALDKHPKDYSMQRIALRLWKAGVRL